jgi:hypothetical protein
VPDDEAESFYAAVLGWQFAKGSVPRAWRVEDSGLPDSGLWGGQVREVTPTREFVDEFPGGIPAANGLDHDSVVSCDNIVTVPKSALGRHIGFLLPDQETMLAEAIRAAFDLV